MTPWQAIRLSVAMRLVSLALWVFPDVMEWLATLCEEADREEAEAKIQAEADRAAHGDDEQPTKV